MAKEKKPVIRKCHKCGKPLDEDKDFCLYCGETYQNKKKERKPVNKKLVIMLSIIVSALIVLAVVAVIVVNMVIAYMNESRYERLVKYIKANGEVVYDIVLTEPAESTSSEEASSEESSTESSEEASSEESSSIEESTEVSSEESSSESASEEESVSEESTEEERLVAYKLKMDNETYLLCDSKATNTFYLCRDVVTKEYSLNDLDKPIEERTEIGEFRISFKICLSEKSPLISRWDATVVYDSFEGYQGYDFERSYTGSMKPYDFTYLTGVLKPDKIGDDDFVNPFYNVHLLYAELEGIDLEMKLEDIVTAMYSACFELDDETSDIIPLLETAMREINELLDNEEIDTDYVRKMEADAIMKRFNEAYYEMYPDKIPPAEEELPEGEENPDGDEALSQELSIGKIILMASSSTSNDDEDQNDEDQTDGEQEETEDRLPQLPPSQEILAAAIDMLSYEACYALDVFGDYLTDNHDDIKVNVGEVGFVKYQEYLDSLIIEKR